MDDDQLMEFINQLRDGNAQQRRAASYNLRDFKHPAAVAALINAYEDTDMSVRQNVVDGLRIIQSPEAINFLKTHRKSIRKQRGSKPHARRNMLYGGLWLIGGPVFMALSFYAAASPNSGATYVGWGAILWGGIKFFQGLVEYLNSPD